MQYLPQKHCRELFLLRCVLACTFLEKIRGTPALRHRFTAFVALGSNGSFSNCKEFCALRIRPPSSPYGDMKEHTEYSKRHRSQQTTPLKGNNSLMNAFKKERNLRGTLALLTFVVLSRHGPRFSGNLPNAE